jgi:hypothetical protein
MTRALAEKLAWIGGGVVLLAALLYSPPDRPVDPTLWMASIAYLLGLHWVVAFCFGGTMYGALRLQPSQRLGRAVFFAFGLLLVVSALQFLLGFGGPFT